LKTSTTYDVTSRAEGQANLSNKFTAAWLNCFDT